MKTEFLVLTAAVALAGCLGGGCGKSNAPPPPEAPAAHHHVAPHGGTAVVLGQEEYHLELVLDAPTATMQAYVLDGEMEDYVRIAAPSFDVSVKLPGGQTHLTFEAVPNRATGETVGNTSQFVAHGDWLKTAKNFDAVLQVLPVKGSVFKDVPFNFPKGNDTD